MAQTRGWLGVGASTTFVRPIDDDLGSALSVGPLIRLMPRDGWGVAGALNWFEADVTGLQGTDLELGRLRVRPVMAGVAYTFLRGRVATSLSIVAGYAFNRFELNDDVARIAVEPYRFEVDDSLAWRPGVSLSYAVADRVALVGFGGYLVTRPDARLVTAQGT
jgi:hypothetical protein